MHLEEAGTQIKLELIRCFRHMIHEDVGSRGGIFGWIKSGILPIRLKLETHQGKTFSY